MVDKDITQALTEWTLIDSNGFTSDESELKLTESAKASDCDSSIAKPVQQQTDLSNQQPPSSDYKAGEDAGCPDGLSSPVQKHSLAGKSKRSSDLNRRCAHCHVEINHAKYMPDTKLAAPNYPAWLEQIGKPDPSVSFLARCETLRNAALAASASHGKADAQAKTTRSPHILLEAQNREIQYIRLLEEKQQLRSDIACIEQENRQLRAENRKLKQRGEKAQARSRKVEDKRTKLAEVVDLMLDSD